MRQREIIRLCSETDCYRKDCPNYSNRVTKQSFHFPDCIEKVTNVFKQKLESKIPKTSE